MNRIEQAVREFHATFGIQAKEFPVSDIPDDLFNQRLAVLGEEKEELEEAEAGDDIYALAKESIDVIYAAAGNLVALGFPLDYLFEVVHKSNMSKAPVCDWCHGEKKVPRVGGLKEPCGLCGGKGHGDPIVKDGKVLKPDTYVAPDLQAAIEHWKELTSG